MESKAVFAMHGDNIETDKSGLYTDGIQPDSSAPPPPQHSTYTIGGC